MKLHKVLNEAKKAAKGIVLQKNVGNALMTGNAGAVGLALGTNAAKYGIDHVNWKKAGVQKPSVGAVGAVAKRVSDYSAGKAPLINAGDVKIGAKYAMKHGGPAVLKRAGVSNSQIAMGRKVANAVSARRDAVNSGKSKWINKGDVAIGARVARREVDKRMA